MTDRVADGSTRLWRAIALLCAVIVAVHVWQLPAAWNAWHGGAADAYPGSIAAC